MSTIAVLGGLHPSPPPFAEVLTGEGTGGHAWVLSPVATSGNGGESERGPIA